MRSALDKNVVKNLKYLKIFYFNGILLTNYYLTEYSLKYSK